MFLYLDGRQKLSYSLSVTHSFCCLYVKDINFIFCTSVPLKKKTKIFYLHMHYSVSPLLLLSVTDDYNSLGACKNS